MSFATLFLVSIALLAIFGGRAHAVINTGLLTKGVRSEFFNAFDATKTHYQDLATSLKSTTRTEQHRWLGTVPQMREFGTGRVAKGLRAESFNMTNLKYEATLEVDRDELDDDQIGQINIRVRELASRAASHKDYLIALLLANGGTSGYNSYDGVSFFNDAHVSGDSGNQDNNLTASAAAPATPTIAEFQVAVASAIQSMMAFKDDQGQPMMVSQSGITCVVPTNMYFNAVTAMQASLISNTDNALKGVANVIAFPWLTTTDVFYVLKTDGVIRPFIFQDRAPIEFGSLTGETEEGFLREKYLYGIRARYKMDYGYWQYAVKVDFN